MHNWKTRRGAERALVFGLVIAVIAGSAAAHPVGEITIDVEAGQLVTGFYSEEDDLTIPNNQVFAANFDDALHPFVTHHPGVLIEDGAFSPHASIGFNIVGPLQAWNGGGYDAIDPAAGERLTISYEGEANSVTTGSGFAPGFELDVHEDGGLHADYAYTLFDSSGKKPDPGIYLLELEFFTDMPGVADSDSVWIVFNYGVSHHDHELAIGYVFDFIVPAPGAGMLLAAPLLVRSRRRRRA